MNTYEEKYKQALERARECYRKSIEQGWTCDKEIYEQIFPELSESEDERIKREILQLVSISGNGNQFEEIKDWLEKQGEQKPDFCHHEVDLSNCSEEYRKAYYDGWNNCNQQHAQLEAEQKPTWGEEDEKLYDSALWHIEKSCGNGGIYNWLKSLKDRVQLQPKQEWSEYDKIQLSEAIQMIEANGTWIRSEDAVKKVSNWLKSLKPNTH